MEYRNLLEYEIAQLEASGCTATNWNTVSVKDGFNPSCYIRVNFSGNVKLGNTRELFVRNGVPVRSGIYDATIHNCEIGDNVHISKIGEAIANYRIGDNCYIANVKAMFATGASSFGNGCEVNVMSETGSRSLYIYEGLTSQIAYLTAMYRHNEAFTTRIKALAKEYSDRQRCATGLIESNVTIAGCGTISDTIVRTGACIEGATHLFDGTVGRDCKVGDNVIASHFIMASQARVDSGSTIERVFVGQASSLANGFIAHDSLFFANCACECGEACAVFAGPHTVSMHKSTLLIGGMFSFFNAGSGTNESNHLYKLGPVHHGIMERGCKTASNAYITWPAHIGPFTLVAGSHTSHPDTTELPYSYLMERKGKSLLIPAANLKTSGTIRDILKWGKRDRRSRDIERLDLINYDALNPLITWRVYQAINTLDRCEVDPEYPLTRNFTIEYHALRRGRELYALAADYFMGESVVNKLLSLDFDSSTPIEQQLKPEYSGLDQWIDLAGLIVPRKKVGFIIDDIVNGTINSLEGIVERLKSLYDNYEAMKWSFVVDNLRKCYSKELDAMNLQDLIAISKRWSESIVAISKFRYHDAMKDYSESMKVGFGVDSEGQNVEADFQAVRGLPEQDPNVEEMNRHYDIALKNATTAIKRLEKALGI